MSAANWAIWAALSAVAAAASVWHYRRWETPGRGRMLLAGLRTATLSLLLLLLLDPQLPAAAGVGPGGRTTQVLLDASLSMTLPTAAGPPRWEQAVQVARDRAGGRPILLFGDGTRAIQSNALPAEAPGDGRTRLLPALQAAAEAGVSRVVVVTDGGIEDAEAVARWLPRLGVEVAFEVVGDVVANRSLVEADAPAWAGAGEPVRVEFGVTAATRLQDSIAVVARVGERVVGRTAVAPPAAGRVASGALELRLEAPPGGGRVAVTLELEGSDVVPDDDVRTLYVEVAEEPAGIALVSFRPDWEPRFLAPVLQQAAGLPMRAFLLGTGGQYVRLGAGLEAGVQASEEEVRGAVQRAIQRNGLVVLHGVDAGAPGWASDALRAAPRLLVFPGGDAGELPLPVQAGAAAAGDFFPVRELPPSPVAPLLAELPLAEAAPLTALRGVALPPGAWVPLLVTRSRQGAPQPAIVGGQAGGRRWVVALGDGYWQWAFRGGEERQLYNRLWGALGGWLLRERGLAAPEQVRPASFSLPRATNIPWVAPGLQPDSVALVVTAANGAVTDTVIVPAARDTAWSAPLPPGRYSYRARAFAGDTVTEADGEFTVERFSPEFAREPVDLTALRSPAVPVREGVARRMGTPLHATPWPWVLVVLLLAAEWVLRRKWGLR
jgi:hypothetical protein